MRRRPAKAVLPVPVDDTADCAFDRANHEYSVAGEIVPSVTQVINEIGFADFSQVPADILLAAQQRGTYVHTCLHYFLIRDFDLPDTDPRFRGYVDSAIAYLESADLRGVEHPDTGQPIAVEYRFRDREKGFAGTLDYLAWDPDGVLVICDFKTGVPSDAAAPLQLAAYEYGVRRTLFPRHGFPIRRRALKLFPDGSPARVEPYADPRDLGMFFSALAVVRYERSRPGLLLAALQTLDPGLPFLEAVAAVENLGVPRGIAIPAVSCLNFRRNKLRHSA